MKRRPLRECVRCGRLRPHYGHGMCGGCNSVVTWPDPLTGTGRGGRGVERSAEAVEYRRYRYLLLRREYSVREAARRLEISVRTAARYEARLRPEGRDVNPSAGMGQGEERSERQAAGEGRPAG